MMVCVCKNGPHNCQAIGQMMKIAATLKECTETQLLMGCFSQRPA
jgi:hypothetical protein